MQSHIDQLIDLALREDIGTGDVTAEYFVPADAMSHAQMIVKDVGVVAGLEIVEMVFNKVDSGICIQKECVDGDSVEHGKKVMEISGSTRSLLTAERTALNFIQRLSGVATMTAKFVNLIRGTNAQILDTRKTTPGWRQLEKMAVIAGGGTNHRMGLYDRIMVKDNHLVAEDNIQSIQQAMLRVKKEKPEMEIELEADSIEQVKQFLTLDAVDYILLDNMSNQELSEAVSMRGRSGPKLEASGGVNLETVTGIAQTGVDFISVGATTHSAKALDISLDFVR